MGIMFGCPHTFGHAVLIVNIEIMLELSSLIVLKSTGRYMTNISTSFEYILVITKNCYADKYILKISYICYSYFYIH